MKLPDTVLKLIHNLKNFELRPMIVGGYLHDHIWSLFHDYRENHDIDIEVWYSSPENTEKILNRFGYTFKKVGISFGVFDLIIDGYHVQISHPRRERKMTDAEKGQQNLSDQQDFVIEFENISFVEACARRAFTTKSAMYDPLTGELFDYFGEVDSIRHKSVDLISGDRFIEDACRVLILTNYLARYDVIPTERLIQSCYAELVCQRIPSIFPERIGIEIIKMMKYGNPMYALWFLYRTRWISHIGLAALNEIEFGKDNYPFMERMWHTPQDPEWHPEGNVYVHSAMTAQAAHQLAKQYFPNDEEHIIKLTLAAWLHDVTKCECTTFDEDGHIRSKGHPELSRRVLEKVFPIIGIYAKDYQEFVIECAQEHIFANSLEHGKFNAKRVIRRFYQRCKHITLLDVAIIIQADNQARPKMRGTLSKDNVPISYLEWYDVSLLTDIEMDPIMQHLLSVEKEMQMEKQDKPLVNGKHLMEWLGISESKHIGKLKQYCDDAYLNGEFKTIKEAKTWVLNHKMELI